MQVHSASKSWSKNISRLNANVLGVTADILGDATEGYIVNVAREEDEELVKIPPSISGKLKPHQVLSRLTTNFLFIYYVSVYKILVSISC